MTTYRDASSWLPPIPLHSGSWDAIAYGDSVYWLQPLYDPSENYLHDVLLSVNSASLARAQLAGQWPRNVGLVDANPRSVIARQMLNSEVNEFYRVPRPLGLGDNPPRALGIAGDSATEDASGFYWMDDNGTVSTCDPEDCVATQKVLANAQTGGNGLLADDKALYWGRSNPPAVMRLAK